MGLLRVQGIFESIEALAVVKFVTIITISSVMFVTTCIIYITSHVCYYHLYYRLYISFIITISSVMFVATCIIYITSHVCCYHLYYRLYISFIITISSLMFITTCIIYITRHVCYYHLYYRLYISFIISISPVGLSLLFYHYGVSNISITIIL